MIVEQIWTGNQFRNFNYLIVCPETGETMAIDPLDHEKCLAICKKNGWEITKVLNTNSSFYELFLFIREYLNYENKLL